MEFLSLPFTPLQWAILGALLIGLELIIPGVYIIWFGFAAILLSTLLFLLGLGTITLSMPIQILLFALFSLGMTLIGIRIYRNGTKAIDSGTLNLARGSEYIGNIYTLETPVKNGMGRLPIGDSVWTIRGEDLPAGALIKIIDVKVNTLYYEQIPPSAK